MSLSPQVLRYLAQQPELFYVLNSLVEEIIRLEPTYPTAFLEMAMEAMHKNPKGKPSISDMQRSTPEPPSTLFNSSLHSTGKKSLAPIAVERPVRDNRNLVWQALKRFETPPEDKLREVYDRLVDQLFNESPLEKDAGKPASEWAQWVSKQVTSPPYNARASPDVIEAVDSRANAIQLKEKVWEQTAVLAEVVQHLAERCEPMRDECSKMLNLETVAIDELANIRAASLLKYPPAQLIVDAQLKLPARHLSELAKFPLCDPTTADRGLDALMTSSSDTHRQQRMVELRPAVTVDGDGRLGDGIAELHKAVFSEDTQGKALEQQIADLDLQIDILRKAIAQTTREKQKAFDEDALDTCEQLHWKLVNQLEELMNLCKRKLGIVKPREVGRKQRELAEKLSQDVAYFQNLKGQLIEDIAGDKERLAKFERALRVQNEAALNDFANAKQAHMKILMENEGLQRETWAHICRKFKELQEHVANRQDLLQDHIALAQNEAKRLEEFHRKLNSLLPYRQTIDRVEKGASAALLMLPHVKDFIQMALEQIKRAETEAVNKMSQKADQCKNDYVDAFRDFYITAGDLAFKKEKHVQEIDRLLRGHKMRLDLMKETLDPNYRQYRDEMQKNERVKAEMLTRLRDLQERADMAQEEFNNLVDDSMVRVHPTVQLQEQNAAKGAKVLALRSRYFQDEEKEIQDEMNDLEETHAVVQEAKQHPNKAVYRPLNMARRKGATSPQYSPTQSNGNRYAAY